MSTQTTRAVDIEDLDEALYWASVSGARGPAWADWVDKLLDVRLTLTPPTPLGVESVQEQTRQPRNKEQDKARQRQQDPSC